MSSEAVDDPVDGADLRQYQAGFMLFEVLVAIVVAALVLGAVGAALAQGWRNTRIPFDVLAGATLARAGLDRGSSGPTVAPPGFALSRRATEITLVPRPSPVAPAPRLLSQIAEPSNRGPVTLPGLVAHAAGSGSGRLQRRTVSVRTPSGRRIDLETVTLDAAAE